MRRGASAFALMMAAAAGCTCGGDPPVASRSSASVATTPAPVPAAEPAPEPLRPPVAQARAFRARLREARRLAQAGQHAEAYTLFAALVRERPADRRLRCEAGYVAFRAGQTDEAERAITAAVESWPSPPMRRDRVPLAMCLYNRGLVAEARGDHDAAARAWRRSLELRPNATVEQRLAALNAMPQEAPDDDEDEPETIEAMIQQMARDFDAPGAAADVRRFPSPTSGRVAAVVALPLPADDEGPESTEHFVLLADGNAVHAIGPEIEETLYFSWYDEHVIIGEPRFVAGPAALGELVAIESSRYGRGDAPDVGDESYSESELHLCAERFAWRCVSFPLTSTAARDCESTRCIGDDAEDDGEETEDDADESEQDDDDEDDAVEAYYRGFALVWRLDGDALVLERDPSVELTAWTDPPDEGRIELLPRFAEAE